MSVEEITHHAGLGMGTLYRHFPTKEELIDAVLEEAFAELVELAEQAAAEEDAWAGLTSFVEQALALHAANRGLKDVLATPRARPRRAEAMRARIRPLLRTADRARAGAGHAARRLHARGSPARLLVGRPRDRDDRERGARVLAPLPRLSCSTACAPRRRRRCPTPPLTRAQLARARREARELSVPEDGR